MKISIFSIKQTNPFKKIKNPQLKAALLAILMSSVAWLCASLFFSLAPWGHETLSTNDGTHQYIPFLGEFWSIFHEGGSLLYSFDGGLGTNMYLTFLYYLLSPFTFVVLFFSKTQIPAAANLIIILKNIFVIAIMTWYLASKGEKTNPILASSIAIAYGLSYYFLSYSFNFMWMDGIALVPLMLYGMERLNTRKGRLFYTLSLALAILTNFYMGAIICIFLALYYVVMQIRFNQEGWTNFFTFSLCSICAAMRAGVVLIPIIRGLLFDNTSRMSSPDFTIYNDAKYFFSRLIPEADIVKVSNNRGTINLYMGVAPVFGILLFLFTPQKSKRVKYGLLFLIELYLFSTQFSFLNWVFHGLYMQRGVPNRYGFLINLLISIASYYSFSNMGQDSSKKIVLAGFISAWYFGVISAWNSSDSLNLAFILSGLALLYMAMIFYKKAYFISLLIVTESLCGLTHLTPATLNSAFTQMEEFITAIPSLDLSGRVEFIGKSNLARNISMLYGTYGASSFNSIINSSTISFFDRIGCYSGSTFYYVRFGGTPISALFLGIQDIISNKNTLLVPSPYALTQELDNLTVYESPYKISLGVIPALDQEVMDNANKFENLNVLYPDSFSLIQVNGSIQNKEMNETEKSSTYNKKYKVEDVKADEQIDIKLDSFEGKEVYLYSYMSGSDSFKVYKNDQELASKLSDGFIVYVGDVKREDEISIRYGDFSSTSSKRVTLQAASLSLDKVQEAGEYYASHCLQNQEIIRNSIRGTYEANLEENMVFTIPYDEGWTAYVNGEKVPISTWQDAFISIPLQSGKNEIKLTFFPLGLKEGIFMSFVGLVLAWFLFKEKGSMNFKWLGKKEDVKN